MCLIGLALDAHPRFRLVVAANRDEFFDRPAAPLDWWRTGDQTPWLLGGRDLAAGGSWMAMSAAGRIGALTNVRAPSRHRADAASRGGLLTAWLDHAEVPRAPTATNPFNLIGGDLVRGHWWWTSDRHADPVPIAPGVHALSNGALDEPWPKVRRLGAAMQHALHAHDGEDELIARLLRVLEDRTLADDAQLPDTGIGLVAERRLSPAFIHLPERGYGTRCGTVVLGSVDAAGAWRVRWFERTHGRDGRATALRSVVLDGWPSAQAHCPVVTQHMISAAPAPSPGA